MRTMAGPDVLIDGVKQAILDPYSATAHNKLITWAPSGFFAARSHALDLRVLGAKDSHASGHQGRPRCRAGVELGEPLHVGAYAWSLYSPRTGRVPIGNPALWPGCQA